MRKCPFCLNWDAFQVLVVDKPFVADTRIVPLNIRVQDAGGVVGAQNSPDGILIRGAPGSGKSYANVSLDIKLLVKAPAPAGPTTAV